MGEDLRPMGWARVALAAAGAIFVSTGCGDTVGVSAGPRADGGSPFVRNVCRGRIPAQHRGAPTACAPVASTSDAAAMACSTSADCADSGVGGFFPAGCVGGVCEPYACLVDGDCGDGGVCSCSGSTFGWSHTTANSCVAGNCRTDADCAPGAYCSPSYGTFGPFYGIQGYYCHTCEDVCTDNSDCATCGGCILDPSVGHWVCGTSCGAG